jgi:hypothetical protein
MTRWEKERFGFMQKGNNLKFFGVEPNGWMRVSDKEPPGNKPIFVWNGKVRFIAMKLTYDNGKISQWLSLAVNHQGRESFVESVPFTHWMPLPEPPEAEHG